MTNWQERAKKILDNRKNNKNNASSATSAPAAVSFPKVIDAPKSTDTWQGKAQQILNKRGYVPPENRMYSLKTNDGQDFGVVSYGAYKAIEKNKLDSYTPKNAEERASLDGFKAYAQEQYEKQQEAEKQKRINSNPTFSRYNIDPDNFTKADFEKWAEEHGFEYRMGGNDLTGAKMKWLPKEDPDAPWYHFGFSVIPTKQEQEDKKVLETLAENNQRRENSQKDLGAANTAIYNFIDVLTSGSIPATADWLAERDYKKAGLDPDDFVSGKTAIAKTQAEHPYASAGGNIVGSVISLGGVSKTVGAATSGIKWLSSGSKVANIVKPMLDTGLTFALIGGAEEAISGGDYKDVLKEMSIDFASGVAGSAVGQLTAKGLTTALTGKLTQKFVSKITTDAAAQDVLLSLLKNSRGVNAAISGLNGAAFSAARTGTNAFLRDEQLTGEQLAQDAAIAFLFSSVSHWRATKDVSVKNKKYVMSETEKIIKEYEQFRKDIVGNLSEEQADVRIDQMRNRLSKLYTFFKDNQFVGSGKEVAEVLHNTGRLLRGPFAIEVPNANAGAPSAPNAPLKLNPGTTATAAGATPTASVQTVSSTPSSVSATKEAVAPVNVAEATPTVPPVVSKPTVPPVVSKPTVPPVVSKPTVPPVVSKPTVPPVVSTPVVAEATPAVKNTNDFTDELSEVASAGAVAKYAPESASADVVSLENKLINVGASDVDRQKVVETAIAVESTLGGTDKSLKDVLADTINITGSAVTAFKQSVGAPKNYWSLFNTNLKTIAALQPKENFIVDYANTFAETLQSKDSVMSRAVADSKIDVASAVSQYALTGNVPEEVKNETVLSGLSKAFTAITEPVLSQIDTAHIAIYGDARTQEPTPEMPAETQTAQTEVHPATTNELQPEEAQKYNIVVSNLKRKAEELGLLDTNFFNTLQNVDLYNPSASDRAAISSEFRRAFAGNTDPLVTDWLNAISVDAQPVTSINEQNMPVSTENTPVNEDVTDTDVINHAKEVDGLKLIDTEESTLVNGKTLLTGVYELNSNKDFSRKSYKKEEFSIFYEAKPWVKTVDGTTYGHYGFTKSRTSGYIVTYLPVGLAVTKANTENEAKLLLKTLEDNLPELPLSIKAFGDEYRCYGLNQELATNIKNVIDSASESASEISLPLKNKKELISYLKNHRGGKIGVRYNQGAEDIRTIISASDTAIVTERADGQQGRLSAKANELSYTDDGFVYTGSNGVTVSYRFILEDVSSEDITADNSVTETPESVTESTEGVIKKADSVMETSENEKITVGMSDDVRAELLNKKSVNVVSFDAEKTKALDNVDLGALQNSYPSYARPIIKKIARDFGILNEPFFNPDIELEFSYSGDSIQESINKQHSRYGDFVKMLSVFSDVIENAVGVETHKDKYTGTRREDTNLKQMYVLASAFSDEKGVYPVKLEVKEFKKNTNKLYLSVVLTKKESRYLSGNLGKDQLNTAPPTSTISISDLVGIVNPSEGDFLKYFPDSMLDSEQVEGKNKALAKDAERIEKLSEDKKRSLAAAENANDLSSTPETTSSTASENIVSRDNDTVNNSVRNNTENDTLNLTDKCELIATKHTATGNDIWVVTLKDRLSSEEYKDLSGKVKAVGGYYSRFAKTPDGKAIPGFVFKTEPTAKEFDVFNDFFGYTGETASPETQSASHIAVEKSTKNEEVLTNQPKSDTMSVKEDFEVGDILEFDGEQWKCVDIDTMMISFENVNKDAFQHKRSDILPYELFKEKTDYKIVKRHGEDAAQLKSTEKPAERKGVTPTTEKQTDISKKAVNDVAEFVRGKLARGSKISSTTLFDTAKLAYGGAMADGVFTPKDAYDAMELGVNKYILSLPSVSTQKMLDILDLLPTQTKRTEEMIKYQQFSTPPSIAYLANYAANINSNDVMLEPSAGIGGIAVFAKRDGATVYVNELDPRRLDIVKELPFDGFYNENAEQIDNILGGEIQPSVIVMNPPFSSSLERNIKGTKIGAKHIEQALQILAPGGRLVAIVGNGMAPDAPAFRQWWKDISAKYNVKANIGINGKNYTKYGTNFNIQMLVIDKDGRTTAPTKVGTVDTLQELENMLGGIRDERPTFDYSKLERTTPGDVEQKATAIRESGNQRNGAVSNTSSTAGSRQPTDGALSSRDPKREDAPKTSSKPGSTYSATPTATDTTANEPGLNGTREPGGAVGVRDSNGVVNGADKQSDLQPGLQGSDGNSRNGRAPSRVSRLKHTKLTDRIFEQYQTAPLLIEGAKQHPDKVSESAAMSAIEAPAITYKPTLPQKVITDGVVSDVQLESISRAGQSHAQMLPNGTRRGYFIGDGTGVGKGRTIAGIILDNYNQGRKKAVWVTINSSLVNDAKRDVKAVFGSPDLVTQFVGGNKADQIMGQDEGILVVSYNSLSKAFDSPGSNFEKIVKWLGKDFDGVIVFDESHKMGNSSDTKGSRGVKKASQTGLAGIALQEALPKARIVYSSATGATEVENLRYAERLGLWGDGTAFASGDDFVSKIKAGGLAAMELVARDLKAMGVYLSRNISYDGVEYDKIEHILTPQQEQIYNELARSWQVVLQNINKALETTNQSKDGNARGRALGAFWSSQQRFFNQILTSMQAPSVIADIEKQLADGKSCVIQLVSTNESAQNEEFARLQAEDLTLDDFDLTPKQMLMSFIEKSFPVQQFEDYIDDKGNKRSKQVYDSKGKPVLNREAIKQRDELLAKLGSIKVPSSPIDMIISHFGTDMVAENTGRQRRVIEKNGKMVEEKIGSKKDADVDAFQNGKKRIIIFSKAGGTGKSYHADKSAKNQQQRVHYVYEPGWQADNAVQGFGRTNRSNQAVPPIYKLVTTNLKGQMRFISTIAKRLDQLGAMTKGQRQAGSTGLFSSEDNLESALASDVLAVFYKDLARNSAEGIDDGLAILEKLGLKDKIIDEYGSIITTAKELREVNKFLNRILTLETHEQNAVFDCYSNRLQEATEIAKQNGTLDKGLENYKADKISLNEEKDIREDESTGATTKYYNLTAEHKLHPTTFADIETNRSNFVGFYQHRTNQSVRAVFKTSSTTDQYGNVHNNFKFVGPAKYDYAPELRLYSNWEKIEEADAKKLWDAELAILPEYRKENLHLIGGVVLPVWDKLPDENVRIYRVLTDKGDMLIGRVIPEDRIDETLRRLGSSRTKAAVPTKDIIAGIKRGDTVYLDNGWRIVQRKVANENRIEIIGPEYFNYDKLKSKGVFSERISYNTRYFIPAGDNAVSVFDEVLKISPVLRVENTRLALGGINDERGSSTSKVEEWRDFQPTSKKGKPIFTDRKGNLGGFGRKKYCEALKADEVEYKTVNGAIRSNFVKEYAYNDDMKNIVSDLQRQGYKKVGFYVGDAHLLYSPGAQCGAITFGEDGAFDEIYIRYDDPDYSPRQLGLHEVGHKTYNTPYGQKIANIIKNSMSFTERARALSSERYQRYMAILKNKDLVFEEFVCDILGGMTKYADAFEDVATAFRNNDKTYIDNYKVSEYNNLIDTGDPNASVLESIGLGNDYRLSESFGDIPYREYVQLRNYIAQKNNSTDALLSTDCKEIGDNFYIWNNTSKTDFTVVGSIPIVGNEDFINAIRSEITNGTYRGTENFNTRANRIRSGKRGRAVLDGRTSRSATDGNNDRLSVRQPENDTRRNFVENSGTDTPVSQTFKSAGTSLNQVAALFKNKNFHPGKVNIDIGGGKFDATSNFLRSLGTENYVFDPFNRTEQENTATLDFLMSGKKADTATCANVLNVIDTEAARLNVILETAKAIKPDGTAYFTVYTSDNSGVGRQTQADSWQNARKTEDYVSEIETYFNDVERKGSIIIAKEPKVDLPKASWEVKPGKAFRYALSTYDTDSESLTPERKKQIFEQFEKDRAGMQKQTKKEIWGERAAWVANNMTRVFPEIPERGEKGTFFAEFRKNMVQWKNLANTASFMVQDKLNKMTDGLTPEEFKTFSELVYFLDLQEEAQIQRERGYSEILLPNEIAPGEVDEIIKVLNKEATENVRQALIKRQNIWDELKDQYISLNQYIGFDTDGKFKRKNYYHHQIIEYMNGKGSGTGSREIGIKAGRGWLKERQGSTKAINTDFLAVEYKAMLQMQYDVYIANMLGKIKKQYDIKPQLEQQAFKNNKKMLNEIIAKEATDKDGNILYDKKGQPDSEIYRQQLWYNQRIMFGFNGLFDLAERNALPTFDGEYSAVVNALKMRNLNVAGLYKYVGVLANMELPENSTDAQEQALINSRTVLKYTAQKKTWIKELLGDQYQTWETLAREMSDTHTIHQPRRGNYFYTKTIIDEDAFNKAFNEMILSLTSGDYSFESVDDVKKLFTQYADTIRLMGAAYEQWVLPKEIVSTMDSVANPKQSHSMAQAARGIVSAWKGWATSVNPLRTIKFGLRNLYGDLDAVIAGRPQVVKYSKRAAQEIYQAMRHKKYTSEFMEWVERGGYTSMILANEMDAEMQDKIFAHLKDKTGKGIFDIPAKLFEGYYDGVKTAHDFREAILRYSAYLYFKETINKNGGVVTDNVASNRYIIKGLHSVEDKAYQLSKDLLGAYDEVGKMGQTLRRYWIPFYSFTETNLKRYYRMFENIIASNDDIPKKAGKLLLKALMVNMLGLLMIAWNKLVMKDADDQLPPSVRNVPHLTLGKVGDDVYAFRQLGSFSEILEWIGLDDYKWTSEDFVAPIDKAWGMITPFVKLPVELASGLNFYPSLTEPRAIRDKWQHFFNSLGVDDIYSEVTGKPTKGVGEILKGGFVYNYDYQESAYYEILDIKRNYQGSNDNTIYGTDAKSNALYYMKTAIRYNDKKAALKYLDEYFEHGGTGKGIKQSFATLNPMYGYTSKENIEKGNAFIASLTDDEKEKLKIAQDYYERELMLPESVSSRLGKKDITDEEAKNLLRNYINYQCK